MRNPFLLSSLSVILLTACGNNDATPETPPAPATPNITYSVGGTLPHDTSYFTEGIEFYKGALIESTGMPGKSKLVRYEPATGKVLQQVSLDSAEFGEGVTVFRDTVYQLTYQNKLVNVYTADGFKKIKTFPFNAGEGWGLTHDSTHLIASTGSNKLFYFEPGTFRQVKEVDVTENGTPAVNLNELEYVNGFIYANQWQYNTILKIDPATGNVVAKMDLSMLDKQAKAKRPGADFLNGIAWDTAAKKFYVTGKYWPEIYHLQGTF